MNKKFLDIPNPKSAESTDSWRCILTLLLRRTLGKSIAFLRGLVVDNVGVYDAKFYQGRCHYCFCRDDLKLKSFGSDDAGYLGLYLCHFCRKHLKACGSLMA